MSARLDLCDWYMVHLKHILLAVVGWVIIGVVFLVVYVIITASERVVVL